jgi:hypothetical protein
LADELDQLAADVWIFPEYQHKKALRHPVKEAACISKLMLHSKYEILLSPKSYSPVQLLFVLIAVPDAVLLLVGYLINPPFPAESCL